MNIVLEHQVMVGFEYIVAAEIFWTKVINTAAFNQVNTVRTYITVRLEW